MTDLVYVLYVVAACAVGALAVFGFAVFVGRFIAVGTGSEERDDEITALPDRAAPLDSTVQGQTDVSGVHRLSARDAGLGPVGKAADEFRGDQFTRERLARLARLQSRRN